MMREVTKMANNYECMHEELLQDHSLKIKELSTKSEYKEQSIMELKEELKQINNKIDKLSNNVNKIILNSETHDTEIEKRIGNLETKIAVYEQFFQTVKDDSDKRTRNIIAIAAVIAAVVGIFIRFI